MKSNQAKIFLIVGNGRDGTTALYNNLKMFANIRCVHHQKHSSDIYNIFHKYYNQLNKLNLNLDKIARKFKAGNIYISNGYSLILNNLFKIHKNNLKVIRIKRKDVKSWKASFSKNIKLYPHSHGNYTKYNSPKIYRMAEWHFLEIKKKTWDKKSLNQKLDWYYKKNENLIEDFKSISNKNNFISFFTEDLQNLPCIKKVLKFLEIKTDFSKINLDKPLITNISLPYFKQFKSLKNQKILQTFYQDYDFLYAAKNPIWGFNFFFNKVLDGYKYKDQYTFGSISEIEFKNFIGDTKKKIKI